MGPLNFNLDEAMKVATPQKVDLVITGLSSHPDQPFEEDEENADLQCSEQNIKSRLDTLKKLYQQGKMKDGGKKLIPQIQRLEKLLKRRQANQQGVLEETGKNTAFASDIKDFIQNSCSKNMSNKKRTLVENCEKGDINHQNFGGLKRKTISTPMPVKNKDGSRSASDGQSVTSFYGRNGCNKSMSTGQIQPDVSMTPTEKSISVHQSTKRRNSFNDVYSVGMSLDTALELSDDDDICGEVDKKSTKTFSSNCYSLRPTSGRGQVFRIAYPSGDPEAVEVTQSDMMHLNPHEFLNDTVIDFYIKYIQRPENLSNEKRARFHFFNTFFYKKLLLEKDKENEDYYSKLRKWTKGVNIFEKYLLVPVHDCAHWSLAVVCFAVDDQKSLHPYILHLDSMKEGHESEMVFEILERYLKAEWQYICCLDNVGKKLKVHSDVVKKRVDVPIQQNAWDCGLFLLYFIQCFVRDAPSEFTSSSLKSMFGRNWFKPQEASKLRDAIRNILDKLMKNDNVEIVMEDMD